MEPILRRFLIGSVMAMMTSSGDGLMCYSCSSLSGSCDGESAFGEEMDCSELPVSTPACFISKTEGKGSYMSIFMRDCVDYNITESDLNCSHEGEGEGSVDLCICNTDLCNKNFGPLPPTQPPSTQQPSTSLKCYTCNSQQGKCDDEIPGTEQNCQTAVPDAKVPACSISEVEGDEPYLARGCVDAEDQTIECSKGCGGGGCESECLCTTDLCNKNWESAGGKPTQGPPPTPGTTIPPTNNLQCYVCSTEFGNCDATAQIGTPTSCRDYLPNANLPACLISEAQGDEPYFSRECADAESPDMLTCSHGCSGGGCETGCLCATDLCNKDWDSAGRNLANIGHKPPPLIVLTCFIIFLTSTKSMFLRQ